MPLRGWSSAFVCMQPGIDAKELELALTSSVSPMRDR